MQSDLFVCWPRVIRCSRYESFRGNRRISKPCRRNLSRDPTATAPGRGTAAHRKARAAAARQARHASRGFGGVSAFRWTRLCGLGILPLQLLDLSRKIAQQMVLLRHSERRNRLAQRLDMDTSLLDALSGLFIFVHRESTNRVNVTQRGLILVETAG
jgi:hypothetical protein